MPLVLLETPVPPSLTVEGTGSSMAEDATQALLTRLGIMRRNSSSVHPVKDVGESV